MSTHRCRVACIPASPRHPSTTPNTTRISKPSRPLALVKDGGHGSEVRRRQTRQSPDFLQRSGEREASRWWGIGQMPARQPPAQPPRPPRRPATSPHFRSHSHRPDGTHRAPRPDQRCPAWPPPPPPQLPAASHTAATSLLPPAACSRLALPQWF